MRNDIVIFRGPSISFKETKKHLDAICLPPAKQGDMYKAYLKYRPKAMGLIDGNFECVPSPWHKEILYLMSKGVIVYGASSMGALRAAELDKCGMIGIGKVYQMYANGNIEDDDEVAIMHAPAELDYKPVSLAMVDIRQTLFKAVTEGVIDPDFKEQMQAFYKAQFYKDRTYESILACYSERKIDFHKISRFLKWVAKHSVEQKKLDAIEMLKEISQFSKIEQTPVEFNNTVFWHNLKFTVDNAA